MSARTLTINVRKLFASPGKLAETIADISDGRISRSNHLPLRGSRLDTPRGGWMILDGHHRAVEAIRAGRTNVAIELDCHVPRIERTGGAYADHVATKTNVADFVLADSVNLARD